MEENNDGSEKNKQAGLSPVEMKMKLKPNQNQNQTTPVKADRTDKNQTKRDKIDKYLVEYRLKPIPNKKRKKTQQNPGNNNNNNSEDENTKNEYQQTTATNKTKRINKQR